MPITPLGPTWEAYLAATGRIALWVGHGWVLRRAQPAVPAVTFYPDAEAVQRVLEREARDALVDDAVIDADLDYAHIHDDYRHLEMLCGRCQGTWPTRAIGPAMAHHLRATLAAKGRYRHSTADHLERAAALVVERTRHGDSDAWLAHRWDHRRAIASADSLAAFLDARLPSKTARSTGTKRRRSL